MQPQWTSELTTEFVAGEDQLGVEGAAQGYQRYLVPGIITVTDRARYYSFYAWILNRFIKHPRSSRLMADFRGRFFRRHETALLLAAYSHHQQSAPLVGLVGAGNLAGKVRGYWESGDPMSLDQPYFSNSLGGFGQYYRTAMQALGIIDEPENPSWVFRLTKRGEALAQAYEDSLGGTAYLARLSEASDGTLVSLSHEDAFGYGAKGCLCAHSLAESQDRSLLRDTFLRFDQEDRQDRWHPHVRRRKTLGLALDLVRNAGGAFRSDMLRPALYLGSYATGRLFLPTEAFNDWTAWWRMVEVRHFYTFALQCLWAAFLLHLSDLPEGMAFDDLLDWLSGEVTVERYGMTMHEFLNERVQAVGLPVPWTVSHSGFDEACRIDQAQNEYAFYQRARQNRLQSSVLIGTGIHILAQLYLRFLNWYESGDRDWTNLAKQERLPMQGYFETMGERLSRPDWTLGEWLGWLYRDYILGQHEFIALEKLRYQGYDTFKFYYREQRFYWPFSSPDAYREPIRLAANLLSNSMSILVDLGFIDRTGEDMVLTADGETVWQQIVRGIEHG